MHSNSGWNPDQNQTHSDKGQSNPWYSNILPFLNQKSSGGLDDGLAYPGAKSTDQQSHPTSEQEKGEKFIERLYKELDEQGLDHGPQLEDQKALTKVCDVLKRLEHWSKEVGKTDPDSDDEISEDVFRIIAPGVYGDNLDKRTLRVDGVSRRLLLQGWTAYNMCSLIFGQNQHDPGHERKMQHLWLEEPASQSYSHLERLFMDTLPTGTPSVPIYQLEPSNL